MLFSTKESKGRLSMSAAPSASGNSPSASETSTDVVVVGAGFAGLYMLYRLRGLGLKARAFEQGDGVGGTWYWNRYPGARCDVESMQYSYSFSDELQQEWDWSERYAPQPEILKYANHVADRFNLRPDIQFNTRVEHCMFDKSTNLWSVTTSGKNVTAQFVVLATGCLSNARMPDIKGIERFRGQGLPHRQLAA
jgi:cyclohexanone monooxygenase